jgi:heat shock protein HtpX
MLRVFLHGLRLESLRLFDILFSILGSIVVAYYSRIREFRADKGGAQFAGLGKMVHALESLKGYQERIDPSQPAIASLKISSKPSGIFALFSTHPPLEVRIKALKQGI